MSDEQILVIRLSLQINFLRFMLRSIAEDTEYTAADIRVIARRTIDQLAEMEGSDRPEAKIKRMWEMLDYAVPYLERDYGFEEIMRNSPKMVQLFRDYAAMKERRE